MHPPFDIRQLAYFVTVADEGQVTRAAAKLHIAQPALSQTIAKLEAAVGVRLLDRHPRGISLTPAGEAFIEKARIAVRASEEAASIVGPWIRAEGTLVMGHAPSCHPVARPILRRFAESHPDVQVKVQPVEPSGRLGDLKAGVIDAELMLSPGPPEADLLMDVVFRAQRSVLLADTHRLAGESSLVFDQIAGETFPGRHPSVSKRWARDVWLSDRRGCDPPVTSETPLSLDEVWALVNAGAAITVLPDFMVPPAVGDGVRAIPLTDVAPIEVALARRVGDVRPAVAGLVAAAMRAAAEPDSDEREERS